MIGVFAAKQPRAKKSQTIDRADGAAAGTGLDKNRQFLTKPAETSTVFPESPDKPGWPVSSGTRDPGFSVRDREWLS